MTKPMFQPKKAHAVYNRHVWHEKGQCLFDVEADLRKVYSNGTGLVPIIDMKTKENVAIWARCHGTPEGNMTFNGEYYEPSRLRALVDEYWPGMPIIMIVCYPKKFYERHRRQLRRLNIYVFEKDYEGVTWSPEVWQLMSCSSMITNDIHEREVKAVLKTRMEGGENNDR